MNKLAFALLLGAFNLVAVSAQKTILPAGFTDEERGLMMSHDFNPPRLKGITTPPPHQNVRTMAEWEELEALCVAWTDYEPTLASIIRHAKEEVKVVIVARDSAACKNQLLNDYNLPDLNNLVFVQAPHNSIWIRDYGPHTIYAGDGDSLATVEWVYNRPRPQDDIVPDAIGETRGIPVYSTTEAPNDLVNTGGNFNSDGLGTAFSSRLVLNENRAGNEYGVSAKTEEQIDSIMQKWQGIDRYIKMDVLPYDGIHHIDMHMRLLNEETLLVGQYPEGVSDGPQIEENLNYVLENFNSVFGTPYKVVRIPMPPESGLYPNEGGFYRTYTNSVIVNKTILVPVYEERYDTTALRIYRENMPGYNVVGIDCNDIIQASGALHCITKAIGSPDPLLIVHQEYKDETDQTEDHLIEAMIQHHSGISNATLYWTTDTAAGYNNTVEMTLANADEDTWSAYIPNQQDNGKVYYYISATANNGKTQVRPLVAPEGAFDFVSTSSGVSSTTSFVAQQSIKVSAVSPTPVRQHASFTVTLNQAMPTKIFITDALGRTVHQIQHGYTAEGQHNFYIDASRLAAGFYLLNVATGTEVISQKLVVR